MRLQELILKDLEERSPVDKIDDDDIVDFGANTGESSHTLQSLEVRLLNGRVLGLQS